MNNFKKIDYESYILNLCHKAISEKIAIDDDAKVTIRKILEFGGSSRAVKENLEVENLIDIIMYYEGLEPPEIGEDLISYVLSLKNNQTAGSSSK